MSTAKLIVAAGYDTVDKFLLLDEATLSAISGIGPVKASSIASGIKQLDKTVRELVKYVTIEAPKVGKMSGKSFCITGKLSKPRAEIEKLIVDHGGEVKSSVGKGTNYLVTNEDSNSSKSLKARLLKIDIISEAELMSLIGL